MTAAVVVVVCGIFSAEPLSALFYRQSASRFTGGSQSGTNTSADQTLVEILRKGDADIDLSEATWVMAKEIPEFSNVTREAYFAQLDGMTKEVSQAMANMQASGYGGADPNDPETRCRRFCSAIIGLHFSYADPFRAENLTPVQMKALYSDPDNITLAELLRTSRGSCVSMPLIYLVIGQRLGMPVHLVALGKHFFIRWEEAGFRMNIETTSVGKIAWTPDDSVYMDIEGIKQGELRGSDLRNLSNREVVGELLFTRMSYWHAKGAQYEAQSSHDLASARKYAPDDPVIEKTYEAVFKQGNLNTAYTTTVLGAKLERN